MKIEGALLPMPSRVLDGERAVFATNRRWIALLNIVPFTGADLDYGYDEDGRAYIREMYPDAFSKLRLQRVGFIYTVASSGFHTDARLGMPGHEFISGEPVSIIGVEEIDDLYYTILEDEEEVFLFDYESDDSEYSE